MYATTGRRFARRSSLGGGGCRENSTTQKNTLCDGRNHGSNRLSDTYNKSGFATGALDSKHIPNRQRGHARRRRSIDNSSYGAFPSNSSEEVGMDPPTMYGTQLGTMENHGNSTSCHARTIVKTPLLSASQKDSNPLECRARRRASLGTPTPAMDEIQQAKPRVMPVEDYLRRDSRHKRNGQVQTRHSSGASIQSVESDERSDTRLREARRSRRRGSLGRTSNGRNGTPPHETSPSESMHRFARASKEETETGDLMSKTSSHSQHSRRSRSPGRHRPRRRGSLGSSMDTSGHSAMSQNSGRSTSPRKHRSRRRGSLGNSMDTSSHSAMSQSSGRGVSPRKHRSSRRRGSLGNSMETSTHSAANQDSTRSGSPRRHLPRRRGSLGNSAHNDRSTPWNPEDSHHFATPMKIKEPSKWTRRRGSLGHDTDGYVASIYACQ